MWDSKPDLALISQAVKYANTNVAATTQDLVRSDIARLLASFLVGGVAAGSGVRALSSMARLSERSPTETADLLATHVPKIENKQPPEQELTAVVGAPYDNVKSGSISLNPIPPLQAVIERWLKNNQNLFTGERATGPWGAPITLGLGVPAGLLAAYGGYKGTDLLLDRARSAIQDSELREAKKQYEQLLAEPLSHYKSGAEALDSVWQRVQTSGLQKQANGGPWFGSGYSGLFTGAATMYAILSALAAGSASYDFFKKRTDRAVLERAMKQRSRQQQQVDFVPLQSPYSLSGDYSSEKDKLPPDQRDSGRTDGKLEHTSSKP